MTITELKKWETKKIDSNLNDATLAKLMHGEIPAIKVLDFLDESLLNFYKKEVSYYKWEKLYKESNNSFLGPVLPKVFFDGGEDINALTKHANEVENKGIYAKSAMHLIYLMVGYLSVQTGRNVQFLGKQNEKLWAGSGAFRVLTSTYGYHPHYDSINRYPWLIKHLEKEAESELSCILHLSIPRNNGGETTLYDFVHHPSHNNDEHYKETGFFYSKSLIKNIDNIVLTPDEGSLTLFPTVKYHAVDAIPNVERISCGFFVVKLFDDETLYVYV
ncbi:MAG: hypothetical protein AAFO07_21340 [Bacteroidota bacterium]